MQDICRRCGRRLTSHRSRKLGFGEECWRRMRAAIAVLRSEIEDQKIGAFTPRQVESATELISDGGIAYVGDFSFQTVSTDGTARYTTSLFDCTCPAGERGEECYHQAAVLIFEAAL